MSNLTIKCLRGCVCAGDILEEGKTYTVARSHGESLIKMGKAEPAEDAQLFAVSIDAPPADAPPADAPTADAPPSEHGLHLLDLPDKTVVALREKNINTAEELDEAIGAGLALTSLPGLGTAGAQKLIGKLDEVLGVEEDDTED